MKIFLPALLVLFVSCSTESSERDIFDLPTLEIAHQLEISESEDLLLSSITNLLVDTDGNVILVDGMQQFIYAVNAEGEFIQQIGGRGSGPGEYQFPGMVALSDEDNFHLFDIASQSVITYAKENEMWNYDSDFKVNFSQYGYFGTFYPAGNQEFYVVTNPTINSDDDSESIVRKINNSGDVVQDSIYAYPRNERFMILNDGASSMAMTTIPSMHRQGRFKMDYDGNLYFGWSDSLAIFRQKPGESTFDPFVNFNVENIPFSDAAKDTILGNYESMLSNNSQARRDLISSFPDTKPIYADYKTDDQGRIWVHMFNREEDREWVVFSEEVEPIYKLSLPDRNSLRAIRHGNVYTTETTEEGLPIINVFSIVN